MSLISGEGWRDYFNAALGGIACGASIAAASLSTGVTLGAASPTFYAAVVVCGYALDKTVLAKL